MSSIGKTLKLSARRMWCSRTRRLLRRSCKVREGRARGATSLSALTERGLSKTPSLTWKSTRITTPMRLTTLTNDEAGEVEVRMLCVSTCNDHRKFYRKLPLLRVRNQECEDDGA